MSETFLYPKLEQKQPKINVWFAYPAIESFAMASLGYLAIFKDLELFNRISAIAQSKTNFESGYEYYLSFVVKSLITGLCVYLAIKSYAIAKKMWIKFVLVFVFIGLFVYIGGDHCVANMFYFSFANKWTGYAFLNIALATLCNSLGTIPGVLLFKSINK